MKKSARLYSFSILIVLFAMGCGQRGTPLQKAPFCKVAHDPIKTADKLFREKTDLSDKSPVGLEPGKYEYAGAEVYYVDSESLVRVHLSHKVNDLGKDSSEIECVGGEGITSDMQHIDFEIPYVSSFEVQPSGKTLVSYGATSIQFAPKRVDPWLEYIFKPNKTPLEEGSLQGSYPDFAEADQIFAKMKTQNSFQYRAQLRLAGGNKQKKIPAPLEVRILVHYRFTSFN